jgi:hypothetical protein
MPLRPEYTLGHSQYNDFLFAAVGAEKSGAQLTVLSAFARLGVDPWQEAERLTEMPRDAAARNLAAILARLPESDWADGDWPKGEERAAKREEIAARLVSSLPEQPAPPIPPTPEVRARTDATDPDPSAEGPGPLIPISLLWGVFVVVLMFLIFYL